MFILHHEDMKKLLEWYRASKRSFPWRDTGDPFDVWISEIMLQQTRTQAVIGYFERFRSEIKDIEALSLIEDDRLMRLWEGLGYYSRARNLKRCAQVLMERYEGRLPEEQEALLSLPGIGPYTAGAILSIGFGRPYPAVDGNVLRVLAQADTPAMGTHGHTELGGHQHHCQHFVQNVRKTAITHIVTHAHLVGTLVHQSVILIIVQLHPLYLFIQRLRILQVQAAMITTTELETNAPFGREGGHQIMDPQA